MSGKCPGNVRKNTGNVHAISGKFPQHVRAISWKIPRNVREKSRIFPGIFMDTAGKCPVVCQTLHTTRIFPLPSLPHPIHRTTACGTYSFEFRTRELDCKMFEPHKKWTVRFIGHDCFEYIDSRPVSPCFHPFRQSFEGMTYIFRWGNIMLITKDHNEQTKE